MTPLLSMVLQFVLTFLVFGGLYWLVSRRQPMPTPSLGTESEAVEEASSHDLSSYKAFAQREASQIVDEARRDAKERAGAILLEAVQRYPLESVNQGVIEFVPVDSEDVKGRIVGREGRNIKAFEQAAGVDLLVDERSDGVIISSFDPRRRAVAKRALEQLLREGRIQPSRIEEVVERAKSDVEQEAQAAAKQAVEESGSGPLDSRILAALAKLHFRTSYGQNVLRHSVETARIGGYLAAELGVDEALVRRACLLHDLGKGLDRDNAGPHAISGMNFLRDCGEVEPVLGAVGAHHGDIAADTPIAQLVIVADRLSGSRPGARRESVENYAQRISSLEEAALTIPGVERAVALQGGREVRVTVKPVEVDDLRAVEIANDLASLYAASVLPGQEIKVVVLRETRTEAIARPNI